MKIRTAILTGVTGVMLSAGLVGDVSAQSAYRYRDSSTARRYAMNGDRQARQMVRQAYRDVLRREPDASGLRQYMDAILNRGWSDADVRRSLLNSPEHAQRSGYARSGWRPHR